MLLLIDTYYGPISQSGAWWQDLLVNATGSLLGAGLGVYGAYRIFLHDKNHEKQVEEEKQKKLDREYMILLDFQITNISNILISFDKSLLTFCQKLKKDPKIQPLMSIPPCFELNKFVLETNYENYFFPTIRLNDIKKLDQLRENFNLASYFKALIDQVMLDRTNALNKETELKIKFKEESSESRDMFSDLMLNPVTMKDTMLIKFINDSLLEFHNKFPQNNEENLEYHYLFTRKIISVLVKQPFRYYEPVREVIKKLRATSILYNEIIQFNLSVQEEFSEAHINFRDAFKKYLKNNNIEYNLPN